MVLQFIIGVGVGVFIGQEYNVPKVKEYYYKALDKVKNYEKKNKSKSKDKSDDK